MCHCCGLCSRRGSAQSQHAGDNSSLFPVGGGQGLAWDALRCLQGGVMDLGVPVLGKGWAALPAPPAAPAPCEGAGLTQMEPGLLSAGTRHRDLKSFVLCAGRGAAASSSCFPPSLICSECSDSACEGKVELAVSCSTVITEYPE